MCLAPPARPREGPLNTRLQTRLPLLARHGSSQGEQLHPETLASRFAGSSGGLSISV